MVLWTPNRKTVEPVRVCPRCGGYERRVADRRDFRRYLSLHRICCCDACFPGGVQIVLSGLTANACSSAPFSSEGHVNMVNVNRTQTIAFQSLGSVCVYYYSNVSDAASIDVNIYTNTTCSGTPFSTSTQGGINITVHVNTSKQVVLVSASSSRSYFDWSGTAALGDTLNNQATSENYSVNGTAVITKA